ncbi:MAG: S41 family peptidase [Candidatus Paceibacterota bacterium]
MTLPKSSAKTAVGAIFFSLIIFGVGFYYGNIHEQEYGNNANLLDSREVTQDDVDFEVFWEAWNVLNEKFVSQSGTSTDEQYTDEQKRVYGAIQGMTRSLGDPYTTFLPPSENETFSETISGEFGGVGMEVGNRDGIITIISPLKGSPAEAAGVQPGDRILKIDGESTEITSLQRAVQKIRGEVGTEVSLTVLREGESETTEITIVRDLIQVPTIHTEVRDDAFVISLYNFSAQSAELFRQALLEYNVSGKDNLVIDLRNNAGGFLQASVQIASFFVDEGKVIVEEDFGSKQEPRVYRSRGYDLVPESTNVVVLVNGGSASASEIVAGALRDHGVAQLVGTQTFGKGSVQELVDLSGETALKVTVARWMTPNGVSISEGGLEPDVVIEREDEEDPEVYSQRQIERAIQVLLNDN